MERFQTKTSGDAVGVPGHQVRVRGPEGDDRAVRRDRRNRVGAVVAAPRFLEISRTVLPVLRSLTKISFAYVAWSSPSTRLVAVETKAT